MNIMAAIGLIYILIAVAYTAESLGRHADYRNPDLKEAIDDESFFTIVKSGVVAFLCLTLGFLYLAESKKN